MAENTAISWTDATFNPWIGCTKVSPGCDNCYAATQDKFRKWTPAGWGGPRKRTSEALWRQPVKWNALTFVECATCGWRGDLQDAGNTGACPVCGFCDRYTPARRRVFCASLADVFDNEVDPAWRADLFALIQKTPNLDWLLLTKRIGNADRMMREATPLPPTPANWPWPVEPWAPLPNVWLGATIVNQEEADRDIPKLLATPARVRFLSMEPLLGPVDIGWTFADAGVIRCPRCQFSTNRLTHGPCPNDGATLVNDVGVDWVIVGGESGPGARPMHPDWARNLRDQCAAAGVPMHFKQWGEWLPWTQFSDSEVDDQPEQTRFQTLEHVDGAWRDVGCPDYWATMDGDIDDEQCVGRVGKKAAGRLLDGVTHDGFPEEIAT